MFACKSVVIFMLISQMGFMVSILFRSLRCFLLLILPLHFVGFFFSRVLGVYGHHTTIIMDMVRGMCTQDNQHNSSSRYRICWPSHGEIKPKPFFWPLSLTHRRDMCVSFKNSNFHHNIRHWHDIYYS